MTERRMTGAVLLGGAALLAACSSPTQAPPQPAPPPVAAAAPPAPAHGPDQCGARELAYLVGHPKIDIPVPVDVSARRVTCTTCPVTLDYSPGRLNILFDAETGVIKQVKCG